MVFKAVCTRNGHTASAGVNCDAGGASLWKPLALDFVGKPVLQTIFITIKIFYFNFYLNIVLTDNNVIFFQL